MRRIGALTLAIGLTLLAGCTSAAVQQTQPAPAAAISGFSLTLNPWQNSGESGQVMLTPVGGTQTQVTVSFTGKSGPHVGFLHSGSCQDMGAVVATLGALDVGASGTGTRTVTVDVPLSTLRDGHHFIAVHEANGTPGNAVACTDIPTQ